jgi:hypothetical protein
MSGVSALPSDAIDGIIHNVARRGSLGARDVRDELVRLAIRHLDGY